MTKATNPPKYLEIGKRLTQERCRLGLKAVNIYESLNIVQTTYKNYEQGNRDIPASILQHLAKMGFDTPYIITGVNSSSSLIVRQREQLLSKNNLSATKAAVKKQQELATMPSDFMSDIKLNRIERLAELINLLEDERQKQALSAQIDSLLNIHRNQTA